MSTLTKQYSDDTIKKALSYDNYVEYVKHTKHTNPHVLELIQFYKYKEDNKEQQKLNLK